MDRFVKVAFDIVLVLACFLSIGEATRYKDGQKVCCIL